MDLIIFLITLFIFLYSVILHEIFHGLAAEVLGDPTPRLAGRISLNPIVHLDPLGSIIIPLFLLISGSNIVFGWAKPVPINYFNLKDKKYGMAKVALAGPVANFILALIFGLILRFIPFSNSQFSQNLSLIFSQICWVNLLLAFFNLVPIPPLDGSHILFTFLPFKYQNIKIFLIRYQIFILLFFIAFGFPFLGILVRFFFKLITNISI
jgi:Zn-dependent protease